LDFKFEQHYPFDKHTCFFGFRPLDHVDSLAEVVSECIRYSEAEQESI
jgi:hypothetical protein